MDVGKLNNRVKILQYTETQSADSALTQKIWTTLATIWADVQAVKGLVRLDTKQIGDEITHKINIRYYPNLTTENWIQFENRRFRIKFVRNQDERNRFLELMCQEEGYQINNFQADVNKVDDPLND